ncbi:hypothetical protein F5Y08DRAFT_304295 [Xylaria arbuscula]|nr:hypothetical protein F5Y08DRAFT_304295 [Xylaria arbuscula]
MSPEHAQGLFKSNNQRHNPAANSDYSQGDPRAHEGSSSQERNRSGQDSSEPLIGGRVPSSRRDPYRCQFCDFANSYHARYIHHLGRHANADPGKYPTIKYFEGAQAVFDEENAKGRRPFTCRFCGHNTGDQGMYFDHLRKHTIKDHYIRRKIQYFEGAQAVLDEEERIAL